MKIPDTYKIRKFDKKKNTMNVTVYTTRELRLRFYIFSLLMRVAIAIIGSSSKINIVWEVEKPEYRETPLWPTGDGKVKPWPWGQPK